MCSFGGEGGGYQITQIEVNEGQELRQFLTTLGHPGAKLWKIVQVNDY